MKKALVFLFLATSAIFTSTIQSCKEEDDTNTPNLPVAQEFIADSNSFSSFMSWPIGATNQGPDPALGTAHAGNDSTVTRTVYFKNDQNRVNGKFPVGTIIVKHSTNLSGSVNEFTAMVKRGNNFNPSKGDWEFFMLNSNGSIAVDGSGMPMRGANLMNGMCGGCHAGASNKDYIFSK